MTDEELASTLSILDQETESETTAGPFSVFRLQPLHNSSPVQPNSPSERDACETGWPIPYEDNVSDIQKGIERAVATPPDMSGSNEPTGIMNESNANSGGESSPSFSTLDATDREEIYSVNVNDLQQAPHDMVYHDNCIDYDEIDETSHMIQLWDESAALGISRHNSVNWQRRWFIDNLKRGAAFQGEGVRDLHAIHSPAPFYHMTIPIAGNSSVAMLVSHYAEHVTHLMQPVAHQNNPFRSLYLPLAIKGSFDMEDYRALGWNMSARAAVFHSIVATAALHLLGLGLKSEDLERLICHHKQQALVALRCALSNTVSTYKELMIAVLSLVSMDVSLLRHPQLGTNILTTIHVMKILGGGTHDHWIHLEAGARLQASRHHAPLVSRETGQLNAICTMLRLFAQTAHPNPEPSPWVSNRPWFETRACDYTNPSIEYLYGITSTIARSIDKIYVATQHITYYKSRLLPSGLLEACEALGDELCSWTMCSESFSAVGSEEDDTLPVAHAHATAFHYASLIYYYRSVQNRDRNILTMEQEATLAAMNEAEDLKDHLFEPKSRPAPISWPAYIASCEAVGAQREKWERWWIRVQSYRLKNFSKQYATVRGLWKNLDRHQTSDWRKELEALNIHIIPV
ncbi:fungal-specific transcription factor domain-containing protein [Penicillium argentinense]|uniref:Fungal-specific transcription factor domain-containing protein n=1 Tax=Penicillium argentinense TaxID=1131581 RepID=A0A9W9FD55_9EURO|nr:fungal-specific transcription factor domain-containing protein [Penicillium argentinense]KAJ5097879.1 fungal-specific transcription factor domain-containing protein [Penicillium argentinense]